MLILGSLLWTTTGKGAPPPVILHDTHDAAKRHTEREKRRTDDFREARETLHAQIVEAYEIATGEAKLPEPVEVAALEKRAGQLPKVERPAYRRTILQIKNWQAEMAEIDRVLLMQDEQDMDDLTLLL